MQYTYKVYYPNRESEILKLPQLTNNPFATGIVFDTNVYDIRKAIDIARLAGYNVYIPIRTSNE